MLDWIKDFELNFEKTDEISDLKEEKFHGSLTLNFSDGVVINCKMNMNIIPTQKKGE